MAAQTIEIGPSTLTIVEELVLPTSARWLLPDAEDARGILERSREWMAPFLNEQGHMLQSMQAFVVKTPERTVVVDTGVGNDRQRTGGIEAFHMRNGPFLEDLSAVVDPADVDLVLTTHMHTDHVGWNTHLVDGRWQPTFPNARYLWVDREWAHWSAEAEHADSTRTLVGDSLQPVFDAGLVDLVPADYRIDDTLSLEPTHGHTPGHVSVRIRSGDGDAVITGDLMHSPLQCAAPDERPYFDRDKDAGRKARREFLERYADTPTLVIGTHFGGPTAGHVHKDGDAFRFEAIGTAG